MRLPIIISATLLLSLGLYLPAMSQTTAEKTQYQTNNNLNLRRLKFNCRLWNQSNVSNYRYTFSNASFVTPDARGPVVIEVRNGQTTSITSVATGKPVNPQFFEQYKTIPKLFNVIQDAINRKAFSLNTEYNAKLGYPTRIDVDYNSQIADEEIFLTIEKFQEIK